MEKITKYIIFHERREILYYFMLIQPSILSALFYQSVPLCNRSVGSESEGLLFVRLIS